MGRGELREEVDQGKKGKKGKNADMWAFNDIFEYDVLQFWFTGFVLHQQFSDP
jgi:hypothetical protein